MLRSAKLAKGWGEGEAQAGSGSEKSVRADQDKANLGGAPGELKRIDLNDSNHPVRTRKPGGVGGGQPPYPDWIRILHQYFSVSKVKPSANWDGYLLLIQFLIVGIGNKNLP